MPNVRNGIEDMFINNFCSKTNHFFFLLKVVSFFENHQYAKFMLILSRIWDNLEILKKWNLGKMFFQLDWAMDRNQATLYVLIINNRFINALLETYYLCDTCYNFPKMNFWNTIAELCRSLDYKLLWTLQSTFFKFSTSFIWLRTL